MKKQVTLLIALLAFTFIATGDAFALEVGGSVDVDNTVKVRTNLGATSTVRSSGQVGVSGTSSATSSVSGRPAMSQSQLQAKIDSLTRLTATEKSVLSANLKADTNMRLLAPEIAILSAIERVDAVIDLFETVYAKLQARLSATTTIDNRSTMDDYLTDMNMKLADASAQITAAQNLALSLKPDQGNRTIMQTNIATLKDARAKVKAAIKDVNDARKDVALILSGLRGTGVSGSATSTLRGEVRSN